MGKRLASILAVAAMLAPLAASALGLGNIVMKSALNQPLDAEIELLSVDESDLSDLRVSLGSAEDFARVGAERAYFLTKIKFDVAKKPDGSPYIKLSSSEFVTEPFLDFVVEARWPRGRILREFTVLVDPPVLTQERPAPIQRASTTASTTTAPRTATVTRQPPIRERAELSPVVSRDGALTYGPVRPNDTLWIIANRMRPNDSVTVNQMMAALVLNNPQAFYNGNANQLKAGYVLRIDDPASITALSPAQADAEIERQRAEWNARKSGKPMRQVASSGTATAPAGASEGTAGGSAEGSSARLKLVAPGSEGTGSGTGDADVDQLRQDLVLAAEALDANRQETEDLKARLAQMEEQLVAMQRLIMLKDDEMLGLQKQLSGETAEQPAAEVTEEMPGEETAAAPGEDEGAEAETAPVAEAPTQVVEPAPVAPVVEDVEVELGLFDDPLLLYGGVGALVLALIGLFVVRRRKMQEGFEESILNVGDGSADAASSDMAQGGEGESSLVSDFAMSEISDISGIQTDNAEVDPLSEADVYLAYGRHQQAEDIIRQAIEEAPDRRELKQKLLEVFFAAKNSEGFASLAEELHEGVDESDPAWAEVVTMGAQLCPDNPLFGGDSSAVPAEGASSGAGMDTIITEADDSMLDFDFDLDSPEIGDEEKKSKAGEDELDIDTDFDFDNDLGLDEAVADVATQDEPAPSAEGTADDNGLDFDVSSLDFNLNQGEVDAPVDGETPAEADALDFEMSSLAEHETRDEADKPALPDTEITEAPDFDELVVESDAGSENVGDSTEVISIGEGDLEFTVESSAEEQGLEFESAESEAELTAETDDSLDFDLDTSNLDLQDEAAIEFDTETKDDETPEFDMSLEEASVEVEVASDEVADSTDDSEEAAQTEAEETDKPAEELALSDDLDEDLLDEDIFGEVDEIGTKLDLAKAYVDMGDGDGARSILDEVLEEGDDDQKAQAKSLLEQIS